MVRAFHGIQLLIGCAVGAIVFYYLHDYDSFHAFGIALLWALAIIISISALASVLNRRQEIKHHEIVESDELRPEDIAPEEHKERLESIAHGENSNLPTFWVQLKVAVHELRLTLEHEETIEQRSKHIKEFLTFLNRYDILIDMYADELTDEEINTVKENINSCAELLKTPDLSR